MRILLFIFIVFFVAQGISFAENKNLKQSNTEKMEEKNRDTGTNLHLIVTITMPSGKLETFGSEIKKMEIISHEDGEIDMIHLVLGSNKIEKTHVWYNYDMISKLSYKFITEKGQKMVHVKILQPSPLNKELKKPLNPLDPMEYR
tara:strand:- start:39777 stop:40211 length:435 start_codon:yes stop_codon:yes gene_type:complete